MISTPRERIDDQTTLQPGTRTISSGPGCTVSSSSFSGARVGVYRKINDYVTHDFKRLSAKGQIFNNPVTISKYTCSRVAGSGYKHQLSGFNCTSNSGAWADDFSDLLCWKLGPIDIHSLAFAIDASELIKEASTIALSNVQKPDVQGLAFAGELRKTIETMRNPLRAATDYLVKRRKDLKRLEEATSASGIMRNARRKKSNRRRAHDAADAASSQYLAIMYGLRPIMMDLEGLADALVRFAHERKTARGQLIDTSTGSIGNLVLHQGSVLADSRYSVSKSEELIVRAGALYAFNGQGLDAYTGVRIKDIPAAAWELLPWSFVVDWFSNLGNVISATVALCTNDFLAEWITLKRKLTYTRTVTSTTLMSPSLGWSVTRPCSDSDRVIFEQTYRYPVRLGLEYGLTFDMSISKAPTLIALSLLLQQLPKGK